METRMFAQISIFANVSLQNVELVGLNSVLLNIIIVHFHSNVILHLRTFTAFAI